MRKMSENNKHKVFMKEAIEIGLQGMKAGLGGPFGAIVVRGDEVIGKSSNQVTSTNDPTAHAEVMAIRHACRTIGDFQLTDCVLYTSCEPCPMCLGAIYWARLKKVYYAAQQQDAEKADFDDSFIYQEMNKAPLKRNIPMEQIMRSEGQFLFEEWKQLEIKTLY
jgi:tRNA(Arg) A34 adenosine deaminase TadA